MCMEIMLFITIRKSHLLSIYLFYIYTCIHQHTQVIIKLYTNTYTHIHYHKLTHTHTHICTYTHIHIYLHTVLYRGLLKDKNSTNVSGPILLPHGIKDCTFLNPLRHTVCDWSTYSGVFPCTSNRNSYINIY